MRRLFSQPRLAACLTEGMLLPSPSITINTMRSCEQRSISTPPFSERLARLHRQALSPNDSRESLAQQLDMPVQQVVHNSKEGSEAVVSSPSPSNALPD